jgi:hypothetical protein
MVIPWQNRFRLSAKKLSTLFSISILQGFFAPKNKAGRSE